jgi:hypothetical protein
LEIKQSPILITGCARSGTSLMAGVINICGAYGGQMRPANEFNEKGMFENARIQTLDKGYLRSIGMDPKGQYPLPNTSNLSIPTNWKEKIEQVMIEEGYKTGPWFYKGARTCLTWPVWHYAFPNAKWVIVRRRSADIAASCLKTKFMDAYSTHDEWIKWVNHHEKCFVEMIQAGLNVKVVWPDRMVRGNYEQAHELIEWLGLTWKPQEVMSFIEPKLWKARIKEGII